MKIQEKSWFVCVCVCVWGKYRRKVGLCVCVCVWQMHFNHPQTTEMVIEKQNTLN